MKIPMKHLIPAATCLLVAGALMAPALAQDTTDSIKIKTNGETKVISDVTVQSAGYDKVVYTVKGKSREAKGDLVVSIKWGDAPDGYLKGLSAVKAGEGEKSRKLFQSCLDEQLAGDLRKWIVEYSQLGLGDSYALLGLTDAGQYKKAIAAYEAAKKANPKSHLLDRILLGLSSAQAASGNSAGAVSAAKELLTAARTVRNVDWELSALSQQARTQLAAGQHAEAGRSYNTAMRAAETALTTEKDAAKRRRFERARVSSAAAEGWVLITKAESSKSKSDWGKARDFFNKLPSKFGKNSGVLAAKNNAMGVIKLSTGDAEGARRLFVYTEVNYFSVGDEVARSLYYQAACWKQLGNDEERDARIRDLKEYYPRSEWAQKL